MRKIAQFKSGDQQQHNARNPSGALSASKHKKTIGFNKNNPYSSQSTRIPQVTRSSSATSTNGPSTAQTAYSGVAHDSYDSLPASTIQSRAGLNGSSRSGAPTVATNPDTIYSETAQSRTATTTTGTGALSIAGAGSTFSSANQSEQSLTTTLTTMHSQAPGAGQHYHVGPQSLHQSSINAPNPDPIMFSHQYPISPAPSTTNTISAIPRQTTDAEPSTYATATANNLLSDNASILTLASSSKRRRRSLESHTDASLRAIPPSSIWSGSRESLPLSVLSGAPEMSTGHHNHNHSRPSVSALTSTERASIYSSTQGVTAPALASGRNSYYATSQKQVTKDVGDAKSLRSFTNADARSQYDTRSINDTKSSDLASLRNYESSTRSGAIGHGRNDSISGSASVTLAYSLGARYPGAIGGVSRHSSDWQDCEDKER